VSCQKRNAGDFYDMTWRHQLSAVNIWDDKQAWSVFNFNESKCVGISRQKMYMKESHKLF